MWSVLVNSQGPLSVIRLIHFLNKIIHFLFISFWLFESFSEASLDWCWYSHYSQGRQQSSSPIYWFAVLKGIEALHLLSFRKLELGEVCQIFWKGTRSLDFRKQEMNHYQADSSLEPQQSLALFLSYYDLCFCASSLPLVAFCLDWKRYLIPPRSKIGTILFSRFSLKTV